LRHPNVKGFESLQTQCEDQSHLLILISSFSSFSSFSIRASSEFAKATTYILNRAIMEGEFTIRQSNIMRWALRNCRSIATELREEFESL
jgi:hypothetical protein